MLIDTGRIIQNTQSRTRSSESISDNFFKKDISIHFFKNWNQFKSRFFSEISILHNSGMDIKKSLELTYNGLVKSDDKNTISNIISTISGGSTFSEAMARSKSFSNYDCCSVRIGEESGTLPKILKELSLYYSKKISQQRQIRSALTYPTLILFTTLASLFFMLNFIVPMFEDVFLRFNGNLPALTRTIISLSNSFSIYLTIIAILTLFLVSFHYLNRKNDWYRSISSKIFLKIPIAGDLIRLTYKIRFTQTMKLLLSSRVHLLESIDLVQNMISFYPLEYALEDIKRKLSDGIPLSESMRGHVIFDKRMVSMTLVAEEVNKLDVVYEHLFQQYSEEFDIKIKTMNNLLEPVLIVFVGGLVAIILISMYVPIFQLGTGIQ